MKKESAEIDVRVSSDGTLTIPKRILKRLNIDRGGKVRVRISSDVLSSRLQRKNVTEEEIDRIAAVQLEPRQNVVRFLAAESRLSRNTAFKHRARMLKEGR